MSAMLREKQIEAEVNLITDFQYLLQQAMNESNLSKINLAARIVDDGIASSKKMDEVIKYITKQQGDDANPTFRFVAHVFNSMGYELQLSMRKKGN